MPRMSRYILGMRFRLVPPVVVGAACRLYGAWWFTQSLDGFLLGVEPMDGWSVAGAMVVLAMAAALAAWIPAFRASRISPMSALRYE